MMTPDMIRADLQLRGWEHVWALYRKPVDGGYMFIGGDMPRPCRYGADWPANLTDPAPIEIEQLRRMHDIILKYERGDYEPRQDGSTPNVARVDSIDAPERLGIQNDRPEYGGVRYRKSRYPKRRPQC